MRMDVAKDEEREELQRWLKRNPGVALVCSRSELPRLVDMDRGNVLYRRAVPDAHACALCRLPLGRPHLLHCRLGQWQLRSCMLPFRSRLSRILSLLRARIDRLLADCGKRP
jgi:hypothetical protein